MSFKMEGKAFSKKTCNIRQRHLSLDRFIIPREYIEEMMRNQIFETNYKQEVLDVWSVEYLQKKRCETYINKALELEFLQSHETSYKYVQPWPCNPRRKSYLSTADCILDLPRYSTAAFSELLDWSKDNVLLAALGKKFYKWSYRNQNSVSQGFAQQNIQCCKFDPTGRMIALGTEYSRIEIHDNIKHKCVHENSCKCSAPEELCSITAMDWSPDGDSFVLGCSYGAVTSFTRRAELINWRRHVDMAIFVVRISPNRRYVAAVPFNSRVVLVMSYPDLEVKSTLKLDWTVKTIAWHPWRGALLGIGGVTTNNQARIALYDAPPARMRDVTIAHNDYCLDAMLFSHRTGEMVLSTWKLDDSSTVSDTCYKLLVLSGPQSVVDQWGEGKNRQEQWHLDRVRTMFFSPDGTKLATATAGEELIIWNFLPDNYNEGNQSRLKRLTTSSAQLDYGTVGFCLR